MSASARAGSQPIATNICVLATARLIWKRKARHILQPPVLLEGEVVIEGGPSDAQRSANLGDPRPGLVELVGHLGLLGGTTALVATGACRRKARAALVRSRMRSRSNSASAPKTWKMRMSLPPGEVVSMPLVKERKPIPGFPGARRSR